MALLSWIINLCSFSKQVVVGNLRYTLGSLEYAATGGIDNRYWIIGVAVGGGLLLLLVIIILVMYNKRGKEMRTQLSALGEEAVQALLTIVSTINNILYI